MVNFYLGHLSEPYRQYEADVAAETARLANLYTGQPDLRKAKLAEWVKAHPAPALGVGVVADNIEHVAKIAGHDHVGIGGDLDGIPYDGAPPGLNSVSGYPLVFAELIRRGWSDADLAKLAGGNLLRVLRQAEAVSQSMKNEPPATARLEPIDPANVWK
jgi:membrane dipeptidase